MPEDDPFGEICAGAAGSALEGRVVCADLAALDQTLVYNRFGSYNPFGMIFALHRDLAPLAEGGTDRPTAAYCGGLLGTETVADQDLAAGAVRLKDCKRPRPVVLRVNVGDRLLLRVTNYLKPADATVATPSEDVVDFSRDFCKGGPTDDANRAAVYPKVSRGDEAALDHGEVACLDESAPSKDATKAEPVEANTTADWPNTRGVNLLIQGLTPVADPKGQIHPACTGTGSVAPDESFWCAYVVPQEGTYFFASMAAPAGGEGDGGSLVHGLFGAVVAEKAGSRWYRSQTSAAAFDYVWPPLSAEDAPRHARTGLPDYEKTDAEGTPILNMAMPLDGTPQADFAAARAVELVHSDLNAIVYCDDQAPGNDCRASNDGSTTETKEPAYPAFREFSVFFHDEIKSFYTRHFEELAQFGQMAGVRDGFAINYGASGMGTMLLANRKGMGPASECAECLYEEFFLTSWANGDPALLEWFADDPSNVHHSYLNDPVSFRNFHAGPKETHVFHLHAHQWFAGNDPNRGTYLDSQTVAPQQGFTYNIYHGGLRDTNGAGKGWWDTQGSGNRNRTVGDSIFHCHLYPHFAQGMWALWRVHDVLEDGTRLLPDGQKTPGLSTDFELKALREDERLGSIDNATGAWLQTQEGTPIPALIPLPGEPLPLLPTYADPAQSAATPMPGYPFYVAGEAGHRPPQAPLDIARDLGPLADGLTAKIDGRSASAGWLDGGLGRHVIRDGSERVPGFAIPETIQTLLEDPDALDDSRRGNLMSQLVAKAFALGDLSAHLHKANIRLLDNAGTLLERAAMGFHFDGSLYDPDGSFGSGTLILKTADGLDSTADKGSYTTLTAPLPNGATPVARPFSVNGSAPKPGAPFADPCGAPRDLAGAQALLFDPLLRGQVGDAYTVDPLLLGFRRYEASAVQLDLIVNQAGWHDPQARINVLTARSDAYKDATRPEAISPVISDREEPFFFRAMSGECIEFRHTNELPKELELDDFQVKTPTDTIGQHIHLVKFDVTASDGSGNGWNYEDGTFAPDELAARRCAGANGSIDGTLTRPIAGDECVDGTPTRKDIWRLELGENRELFQTTVQRWFADPMLSRDETSALRDRTMRTVFTHDHFGPSSIQQHGFYAALVIEPGVDANGAKPKPILGAICENDTKACEVPLADAIRETSVAWGNDIWEGARKRVTMARPDKAHPDYREFALSIADFATLYDPRDRESVSDLQIATDPPVAEVAAGNKGMQRLHCELRWRHDPAKLRDICGNAAVEDPSGVWHMEGEAPPAWLAGGIAGDSLHAPDHFGDTVIAIPGDTDEVAALFDHLVTYRQKAAGLHGKGLAPTEASLAQPVAAPARPESISVDHHDPYLVSYRGAPIPLRIGDKDTDTAQSDDCAPKAMSRQADRSAPASPVETALREGTFPLCSFKYQIAGVLGDMGAALSSVLHGDPETPLLEAYQGERIMFRMIQGAQEVQHSFMLYGQPHKRNIDHAYSAGMQPLGETPDHAATMRADCFRKAAIGRPGEYLTWSENAPANLVPGEIDPVFWADYEALLKTCDNIEGFTFAQEIGISEHFELSGSLRSDIAQSLEYALAPDRLAPDGPTGTASADYLYSFGSTDAIWNGSWGLLRIFRDGESDDPATDPVLAGTEGATPQKIGNRLLALRDAFPESPVSPAPDLSSGLSCPMPQPGETLRVTEAVIVALETRLIWPDGTPYGNDRRDPDGLMLALLPPEDLAAGGIDDTAAFDALDLATVIEKISAAYKNGPAPMVLRVNAGDCLRLRLVNLLSPENNGGLRDLLGDARMPPIVPLNTDPAYATLGPGHRNGMLHSAEEQSLLRPSATLALSIGLPGMSLIAEVPSGFGFNKPPLAAFDGNDVPVSDVLSFYAGRFRVDPDADIAMLVEITTERLEVRLKASPVPLPGAGGFPSSTSAGFLTLRDANPEGGEVGLFNLLGRPFVADIIDATSDVPALREGIALDRTAASLSALVTALCQPGDTACAAAIQTWHEQTVRSALLSAAEALDTNIHWIPYAFGAVPVVSLSDVISHGTSGLIGTVDVVPTDWTLTDAAATPVEELEVVPGQPPARIERRSARHRSGAGLPAVYDVAHEGQTKKVREFVLFYQDGLNLWDEASTINWTSEDGTPVETPDGSPVRMVPECPVCDDSYDLGDKGVNYTSAAFSSLLRDQLSVSVEENDDLNTFVFPPDFLVQARDALRLEACDGEQVIIRVIHPGGRARQRTFVMNGYTYDDLFPGFGFPRSSLLAPGKTMTAWLFPEATSKPGIAVWHDGPTFIRSGGVWGLLVTSPAGEGSCAAP